uniref:Uncharacterized protein n=1 Tax=Anguilla anguilla TaxID=7936 RepID=A0A0E9RW92_ANGAN
MPSGQQRPRVDSTLQLLTLQSNCDILPDQ